MPLVSVILPNYNHAAFLDKRIQSILGQTFHDFELIILDDCSTDNSKEIIEKYRCYEKVSHIVYNEVNSGSTFRQWDKGISMAGGEFIWIAESDDYCEPNLLMELVSPLIEDKEVVIAFCQSLFVTPDEKIINKTEPEYLAKKVTGQDFLRQYLLGVNAIANVSMAVFRKDAILSVPPDYKEYTFCGDWLFYADMCMKGNVFISGKYLNYYLRHETSVTNNQTKTGMDFLEGNKVFHFIRHNIPVGREDVQRALHKRIDKYLQVRNELHGSVKKEVIKSILGLDPSIRRLLQRRMRLMIVRRSVSAIRKLFFV